MDDLLQLKYDGEGIIPLLRHKVAFSGFCDRNEDPPYNIAYGLFSYAFKRPVKQWCLTLPATSIHSFNNMMRELGSAFFHYDCKALDRKILKLRKESNESIV